MRGVFIMIICTCKHSCSTHHLPGSASHEILSSKLKSNACADPGALAPFIVVGLNAKSLEASLLLPQSIQLQRGSSPMPIGDHKALIVQADNCQVRHQCFVLVSLDAL